MGIIFNLIIDLIGIYKWILVIYILMSWFPDMRSSKIGYYFAKICEPFLEPFRKIIPPIGMIDISPLAAFLLLQYAPVGLYVIRGWIGL
jgi:YggT family protein